MGFVQNKNHFLMIEKYERKDDPNSSFYILPGGKVEPQEHSLGLKGIKNSVVREVEEETGIKMINPFLKGKIFFENKERIFKNWANPQNYLVYVLSSRKFEGELKSSDEGIPRWVLKSELNSFPMNEGDKKIYEWIFESSRNNYFFGKIYHVGENLDERRTFVNWF